MRKDHPLGGVITGHRAPFVVAGLVLVTADRDWQALAIALRQRRKALRLRQADLEARGGPGQGTVRNLEQAARSSYARRTFQQLEHALDWPDGIVERILDGTATPEELNQRVVRGSASTDFGPAVVGGVAHIGNLPPEERVEQVRRLEAMAPSPEQRSDSTVALAAELLARLVSERPDVPALLQTVDALTQLVRELTERERAALRGENRG